MINEFLEYFDTLSDDEKSELLNNIFSTFSKKYDISLGFCLKDESCADIDEYFVIPLSKTKVTFCWDEDTPNIKWDVFSVNDK